MIATPIKSIQIITTGKRYNIGDIVVLPSGSGFILRKISNPIGGDKLNILLHDTKNRARMSIPKSILLIEYDFNLGDKDGKED